MSVSIRIDEDLIEDARRVARAERRTVQGQIELWSRIGRASLDNPDLSGDFIAECLISMAEPRDQTTPFIPRAQAQRK